MSEEQGGLVCVQCDEIIEEESYEYVSWNPIGDEHTYYLCYECLGVRDVKPIFVACKDDHEAKLREVCVYAKHNDEWCHGTVWDFDSSQAELPVEWDASSKGVSTVKQEDIKLLAFYNSCGNECPLKYEFYSLEQFLERRGFTVGVEGLLLWENLIPEDLRQSLLEKLDVLAARPEKDFHPGSDDKVQNLFHPSLFCYVRGVSVLKGGVVEEFYEDQHAINIFGRDTVVSRYQWLPSNFQVNKAGKVTISSYINGLGPKRDFPDLYEDIQKLFEHFLPYIEDCLPQNQENITSTNVKGNKKRKSSENTLKLKNRTLQVIVKAANYILQPGQLHEGVWHVEGMSHEHIIATAIYYYDASDNMVDRGLAFRRQIEEEEQTEVIMEYRHENPAPFQIEGQCIDLGTVETGKGKCVVFPNSHQHKLVELSNSSETEVAYRKMICFFVVDPEQKIVSTEEVCDQNWAKIKGEIAVELQKVALRVMGSGFPEVVVQKIVNGAKQGFTLEEAQRHREGLMRDRKYYKDQLNQYFLRDIELCEH